MKIMYMPTLQITCREATLRFREIAYVLPADHPMRGFTGIYRSYHGDPGSPMDAGRRLMSKSEGGAPTSVIGSLRDKVPRAEPNSGKTGTKTGTREDRPMIGVSSGYGAAGRRFNLSRGLNTRM
jgi:hypothetical protein